MSESKYKSLEDLKAAHDRGEFSEGEFRIVVDNDSVYAHIHPGWDDDGEELEGDTIDLWSAEDPREALHAALKLLGLPSENC